MDTLDLGNCIMILRRWQISIRHGNLHIHILFSCFVCTKSTCIFMQALVTLEIIKIRKCDLLCWLLTLKEEYVVNKAFQNCLNFEVEISAFDINLTQNFN